MKKTIGIIEIASNCLRLKIGERSQKGVKVIESISYPLALGRDTFHNGKISFESQDKTADIIKGFLAVSRDYGVTEIHAVATTAVREARNKDYFLDQLKLKTGIELNVIDESQEKIYINKIVYSNLDEDKKDSSLLVHLGSGNINIFIVQKGEIIRTLNIKLGALRISELFDDTIENSADYVQIIKEYLHPFTENISAFIGDKASHFILSGNETDTISNMCGSKKKGKNNIISRDSFMKLYSSIKNKTPAIIADEFDLTPENSEILLPTIIVVSRLMKYTTAKNIISPVYTLGDALLYSYLYPAEEKKFSRKYSEFSINSSLSIAEKFGSDISHIERVSSISLKIFDRMKKLHGMGERERILLHISTILQDIGKIISIKNHNEISYHMIRGLDIVGVNEDDRNIIATAVLYHSGNLAPDTEDAEYADLPVDERVIVSKISAILKLANAVHSSHNPKFDDINVRLSGNKELIITASTYRNINLEKWNFKSKSKLFEDVFGIKAVLNKRSVM